VLIVNIQFGLEWASKARMDTCLTLDLIMSAWLYLACDMADLK